MNQSYSSNIIHLITEADPEMLRNENILEQLSEYINDLIANDFSSLIQLLYRLDIPEKKLKESLRLNVQEDAGRIMAMMIIKRQMEKIELRKKQY